ncbi:MAG TPA: AI-2E family transporter [Candidatus Desulfobacillus sp.]|nr:AI-2E family transporter [Candidatus Desulfobacillus sp.]
MSVATASHRPLAHDIAAWLFAAAALFLVLKLRLLPALLAGLLVHELVHMLAPRLGVARLGHVRARLVAIALLSSVVIFLLALSAYGSMAFFRGELGSLPALMQKMAESIEGARAMLPDWLAARLPTSIDDLAETMMRWLRAHAGEAQIIGAEAGRGLVHILFGMIIGAMISLSEAAAYAQAKPLARALIERAARLAASFRRIVFAQVRIAALNAFFTWLYLDVALPLLDIHLPLAKTMVAVTFIVGLLPVVGNLVSNTVIVIVSLSHSVAVAVASLAFLVVIHKLEYFLNARIVGSRIRARTWELLLAMLAMEAAFGVAGLIAAPIYYAYLKDELAARGQV